MWKRAWVVLGLAVAACKGESKDAAPGPATPPQPGDARRADADARPPDGPTVDIPTVDAAVGVPLPRQPGGILVIDAAGRIAAAEVDLSWTGAFPDKTQPLPASALDGMWIADESGGTGTRLALSANRLTPAKWRAARKRRAKERAIPAVDKPPSRMVRATVSARTNPDDDPSRFAPAVFASPAAPARLLAKVLVLRGGTLLVRTGSTTRALTEAFERYRRPSEPGKPWIELHLDDRGVHVLLIPSKRPPVPEPFANKLVAWGELDQARLGATLAEHAGATGSPPEVDLVVGDGATVQRLVDVIAHLQALGVRAFGVAERAAAPDARHRQEPDRDWIKRTIRQHNDEIRYCYERRLEERPNIAGTVTSTFRILPDGRTALVDATGVDADVADCVALVLEGVRFPPFDLPGGVPVRYPFVFRLAGTP